MKKAVTLLLVLIAHTCFCQSSISFGHSIINEKIFGQPKLFQKNIVYRYHIYTFQGDYVDSIKRLYGEISMIPVSMEVDESTSKSGGGGSSASFKQVKNYHSKVNFSYVTFKMGIGKESRKFARKKLWSTFSFNFFIQYDQLIQHTERDKFIYYSESTLSSSTLSSSKNTTTSSSSVSAVEDNLLNLATKVFQIGPDLKSRFGIRNYFAEFSLSVSGVFQRRTSYTYHSVTEPEYNAPGPLSFYSGVKIGYYLGKKSNKPKVEQL